MADRCPHLDYRRGDDGPAFDTPRAYCTVVDRFVQPMRADVCNARYGLAPADHCEFYREHEGIEDEWLSDADDGDTDDGDTDDGDGTNGGSGSDPDAGEEDP